MSSNADPPARRKTSKRASRLRFEVLNAFVDSGMADLSRAELASFEVALLVRVYPIVIG